MDILYTVFSFMSGALLTSFFYLLADRLPLKQSLMGRSHCDHCKHKLKFIEVLPIMGYIINRGKCRYCFNQISPRHLIAELLGGILFAGSFMAYGWSLEFGVAIILISVLLTESFSDVKHQIVIDIVWIIGFLSLLNIRFVQGHVAEYLLSSVVLFFIMFSIAFMGKLLLKKEALGGGDVKLYLFIGLAFEFPVGIFSIFLSALFGLIYGIIYLKDKNQYLPLVPFITLATFIAYLFGEGFIEWYLNLLGM